MESYEIPSPDLRDPLQRALKRLELTNYAVQEVHYELEKPEYPEHKADLLLATEALALEVFDLLETARYFAWGSPQDEDEDL